MQRKKFYRFLLQRATYEKNQNAIQKGMHYFYEIKQIYEAHLHRVDVGLAPADRSFTGLCHDG